MKVKVISVLEDNYMYLVIEESTRDAVAVDAAVPKRVRGASPPERPQPRHVPGGGRARGGPTWGWRVGVFACSGVHPCARGASHRRGRPLFSPLRSESACARPCSHPPPGCGGISTLP